MLRKVFFLEGGLIYFIVIEKMLRVGIGYYLFICGLGGIIKSFFFF